MLSDVWSENAALFERLMKIHLNPPILYYGFKCVQTFRFDMLDDITHPEFSVRVWKLWWFRGGYPLFRRVANDFPGDMYGPLSLHIHNVTTPPHPRQQQKSLYSLNDIKDVFLFVCLFPFFLFAAVTSSRKAFQ